MEILQTPARPEATPFVLLDDATCNQARLLWDWRSTHTFGAAELDGLDAQLHHGWAQGWHAFLWLPYEWGQALQHLPDSHVCAQLHWFAQASPLQHAALAQWLEQAGGHAPAGLCAWADGIDEASYRAHVAQVQAAIARGEVYQINYTTRAQVRSYGHPAALYRRLRQQQPVPYGLLARLPGAAQACAQAPLQPAPPVWTLGFSPELFLRIQPDGLIETEPMKGTAARDLHDPERDQQRAQALVQDLKNRAENVMIVDLLRNDLGRIAEYGSVAVPRLFHVAPYGSVWQMTSRIQARPRPGTRLAELLRATFPCGSITGAPKRMSMEKIRDLETAPRGIYTGSVGHLAPADNPLGCQGALNVAIRTLQLHPRADGLHEGDFGVGSGIVADSDPADEWRECQWKSRFLRELPPQFSLIETLRAEHGHCPLLPLHRQRLEGSAHALRFPPVPPQLWEQAQSLAASAPAPQTPQALRIEYFPDGRYELRFRPATLASASTQRPVRLLIAPEPLPERDFLRRFKTSHRAHYDQGRQNATAQGAFDSLFFNTSGHLLEGGICNVFVRLDGQWHTPALELDILEGVMRRAVLADPAAYLGAHSVRSARLSRQDLARAEAIAVSNAFQGLLPAQCTPGQHATL